MTAPAATDGTASAPVDERISATLLRELMNPSNRVAKASIPFMIEGVVRVALNSGDSSSMLPLTNFARLEVVVRIDLAPSLIPSTRPASRYSPISAHTLDGELIPKILERVLVTLRARDETVEVSVFHALLIPRCKPETSLLPMDDQSVCFRVFFRSFHFWVTVVFNSLNFDDAVVFSLSHELLRVDVILFHFEDVSLLIFSQVFDTVDLISSHF